MWKLFPAVAACAVFATVHAQTIYKCSVNGALWYGDRPCTAGVASELAVTPAPPPDPDTIARLARQHALAQQLIQRDAARDYHEEMEAARELQRARRAASTHKLKCDRLRLRQQWAQEDVRGAADKSADKARIKARRQGQAMALECPS
ncbi:MAG TPA: DUF4124 domain-containing protein [Telluria sp.]|jgi:hypothetical protein